MKTTLEQWRMFKAVVEYGGYAQAADAIHKSQSTISYGVHKLQEQLGVQLLEVEGRQLARQSACFVCVIYSFCKFFVITINNYFHLFHLFLLGNVSLCSLWWWYS